MTEYERGLAEFWRVVTRKEAASEFERACDTQRFARRIWRNGSKRDDWQEWSAKLYHIARKHYEQAVYLAIQAELS